MLLIIIITYKCQANHSFAVLLIGACTDAIHCYFTTFLEYVHVYYANWAFMDQFCFHQSTPLHLAAEGGHLDTVKYLVEKGANIHSEKFFGVSV